MRPQILPDRSTFDALAADWAMVPVWAELLADVSTPVGLFPSLAGGGPGVLLESVERSERWGRFSFVAGDPAAIVVADGDGMRVTEVRRPLPLAPPERADPRSARRDRQLVACSPHAGPAGADRRAHGRDGLRGRRAARWSSGAGPRVRARAAGRVVRRGSGGGVRPLAAATAPGRTRARGPVRGRRRGGARPRRASRARDPARPRADAVRAAPNSTASRTCPTSATGRSWPRSRSTSSRETSSRGCRRGASRSPLPTVASRSTGGCASPIRPRTCSSCG